MIAHIPLFSHPNPERILLVGGGDGGTLREILKHSSIKEVTMCEINETVMRISEKFFPQLKLKESLQDLRVKVVHSDASEYMKEQKEYFDIIIVDSSDPVGPAAPLFELPFFNSMFHALRPRGKICTQAECIWLNLNLISKIVKENMDSKTFIHMEYATTQVPTYPSGQIEFYLDQKNQNVKMKISVPYHYANRLISLVRVYLIILPIFTEHRLFCLNLLKRLWNLK